LPAQKYARAETRPGTRKPKEKSDLRTGSGARRQGRTGHGDLGALWSGSSKQTTGVGTKNRSQVDELAVGTEHRGLRARQKWYRGEL
jgi:hypothetical protein